jgi:hypothetical protein
MYVPGSNKKEEEPPSFQPPIMDWVICVECREVRYLNLLEETQCCGPLLNAQEIFKQHARLCKKDPEFEMGKNLAAEFLRGLTDVMNVDMLKTKEE